MNNKYEVIGLIGEGTYGVVYKCRCKLTKELVAIKKLKGASASIKKSITRELHILKSIKHSNIVEFKEAFQRKGSLYLVFEYVDGNLLEMLRVRTSPLTEDCIKSLMYQLCNALSYLHSLNIIHRDIKPENILIESSSHLKLCDFGFSRKCSCDYHGLLTNYISTRWYRAPELLVSQGLYDNEIDYWAAGCIMGELIDGMPLFPGHNEIDQLHCIQKVLGNLPHEQIDQFYRNPAYVGHRFLSITKPIGLERRYCGKISKAGIDFLKGLLELNPKHRLNSITVLKHPYLKEIRLKEEGVNRKKGLIMKPKTDWMPSIVNRTQLNKSMMNQSDEFNYSEKLLFKHKHSLNALESNHKVIKLTKLHNTLQNKTSKKMLKLVSSHAMRKCKRKSIDLSSCASTLSINDNSGSTSSIIAYQSVFNINNSKNPKNLNYSNSVGSTKDIPTHQSNGLNKKRANLRRLSGGSGIQCLNLMPPVYLKLNVAQREDTYEAPHMKRIANASTSVGTKGTKVELPFVDLLKAKLKFHM